MITSRKGSIRPLFGWFMFLGLAIVLFLLLRDRGSTSLQIPFSTFRSELLSGNVSNITIEGDVLRGQFRKSLTTSGSGQSFTEFRTELPPGVTGQWTFVDWLSANANGATISAENAQSVLLSIVVPLIPWFLIFGFIWFFVFRNLRKANPGKTPAPVYIVPPPDNPTQPPSICG